MSLEKKTSINKIEVMENGVVQVQFAINVVEDGAVISSSFHRTSFAPGQNVSGEDEKIKNVCSAIWTDDVIAAFEAATAVQGV